MTYPPHKRHIPPKRSAHQRPNVAARVGGRASSRRFRSSVTRTSRCRDRSEMSRREYLGTSQLDEEVAGRCPSPSDCSASAVRGVPGSVLRAAGASTSPSRRRHPRSCCDSRNAPDGHRHSRRDRHGPVTVPLLSFGILMADRARCNNGPDRQAHGTPTCRVALMWQADAAMVMPPLRRHSEIPDRSSIGLPIQ